MSDDRLPDDFYEKLFAPLTPQERQIMALRFGLDRGRPRTMEEVGSVVSLPAERIRQVEAVAVAKLRSLGLLPPVWAQ